MVNNLFGLPRPQHLQMPWACVYGNGDGAPFFQQVAENPCWDWYTEQITEIKTPNDALSYTVQLASSGWQFQDHVWNTVQATLHTSSNLYFMDIHPGQSDEATKALSLTLHIAQHRMWTMSKHSLPPDCYAAVTSASADIADQACATMKTHYQKSSGVGGCSAHTCGSTGFVGRFGTGCTVQADQGAV